MSPTLKDLYSPAFYNQFSEVASGVIPGFHQQQFVKLIFARGWEKKELKDRMRHTSNVLRQFMPDDFKKASRLLQQIIHDLEKQQLHHQALQYMFIPDYIEQYGLEDLSTSVTLFEKVTPFTSCEFAVRPFILRYGQTMIDRMIQWSTHKNHHVRRLASEGSRPRLPWAMALPALKKDPSPNLPLLNNLKEDPSEYVRRSVANHLNDISKDHPALVLHIAKKWIGKTDETDALLKHACRTMLKQGDAATLKLFGHVKHDLIKLSGLKISTPEIKIPESINFRFSLTNEDRKAHKIRLEYAIHYLRQNGTHSKKVFKICERLLNAGENISITRAHSFRLITTRKYYPGIQKLSVIVNGEESKLLSFKLKDNG